MIKRKLEKTEKVKNEKEEKGKERAKDLAAPKQYYL